MDPQTAGSASPPEHPGTDRSQHLAIGARASAASSLRRMFTDTTGGMGSGTWTPATVDERTSLLSDTHSPGDLEQGPNHKKAYRSE